MGTDSDFGCFEIGVCPRFSGEWRKDDGTIMQIGRGLVDSGYVPEMIYSVIRRSGRMSTIMPSKGIGIGPDGKPFSNYIRKAGEQYGFHWRIPSTRGTRELPTVSIDTNFWKTFVTDRLATGLGDGGSLSLFGQNGAIGQDHQLLSEHLTSEYRIRTQGRNRVVDVWKGRVNVVDNHWFDCLVGCAVGASMLGSMLPGVEVVTGKKRQQIGQRMRLSDRQRGRITA
jgi:phage terminase large subunit GpA-like protein